MIFFTPYFYPSKNVFVRSAFVEKSPCLDIAGTLFGNLGFNFLSEADSFRVALVEAN